MCSSKDSKTDRYELESNLKANIGCGRKVKDGWINLDKFPINENVVFCDLDKRIPLEDESCKEIMLDNVIEHVADIPFVMAELCRCLAPKGELTVITPHFSSDSSFRDPTHKYHLSYFSFDYLGEELYEHYIGRNNLLLMDRKLSFGGGIFGLLGRAIFKMGPKAWEKNWCFIFRGSTLRFRVTKA